MAYVKKKRPYKKEYEQQKERGEQKLRNARERARYAMDRTGVDKNRTVRPTKERVRILTTKNLYLKAVLTKRKTLEL